MVWSYVLRHQVPFLLLWFMDDAFKWILPLMQLREFWMQRRWQLHLLWHLLVVCTLLTWNTTWAFEDKFYHVASVAVPPSFVSCRLSKVCLNPSFTSTTHGWLQPPSLCVGQISNPNMASNISFSLMKYCLLDTLCWDLQGTVQSDEELYASTHQSCFYCLIFALKFACPSET